MEEAVVAKKLVEVAAVVLLKRPVKFAKVEEAVVRKPPVDSTLNKSVPTEFRNFRKLPVKLKVLEAVIRSPVVLVAFTARYELLMTALVEVAPITTATVEVGAM